MKNLVKLLFAGLILGTTVVACNDKEDNGKYIEENIKYEKAIDSILRAEDTKIRAALTALQIDGEQFFQNPTEDSVKVHFNYIDNTPKRGIYYEVLNAPAHTDDSYKYRLNDMGNDYHRPKVEVKYTAYLLDGKKVQGSDDKGTEYFFNNPNRDVWNNVWFYSFYPYKIQSNGRDYFPQGLTEKGLIEGSKIRVIAPSPFAFGSRKVGDIPANSPLAYEFEVISIK